MQGSFTSYVVVLYVGLHLFGISKLNLVIGNHSNFFLSLGHFVWCQLYNFFFSSFKENEYGGKYYYSVR